MVTKRTSAEIRSGFLEYFHSRGHEVVQSAGVVPRNDPTLLFTNAGMVQFKDVFLGADKRAWRRAASSQKCIRMSGKHNDLENVGRTARHHTFFEMLGNFSFGDYFKRDAIGFAWELLTVVWGIPRERLMVTVFGGEAGLPADDEARAIWREVTGYGDDRIVGLGRADNFWSMGDTGPCGPCTEIHYWMGAGEPDPSRIGQEPGADGVGWVEIWNNVFMQFNREVKDGPLAPLPAPCVDTGMGLERVTAVLQGVYSNYDTDLLRPLVELAGELVGKKYLASDSEDDVSMRVLADHARMAAFALAEGVLPENKGRGSALRQVMRRAIRRGYMLGLDGPGFYKVVARVTETLGGVYPELAQHREFIVDQVKLEEDRFGALVPKGTALLNRFFAEHAETRVIPGDLAFDLYSTYGFPLDLTQVIAGERGFRVDVEGYESAQERHGGISDGEGEGGRKGVSREERVRQEYREALARVRGEVGFVGYETERAEGDVVAILKGRPDVREPWPFVDAAGEGDEVMVVTSSTPFYGESGGQVGDSGRLATSEGEVTVTDTQKPVAGLVVHVGKVTRGVVRGGARATLTVDGEARSATRRNHSATHLLHWALRKVLGPHAQQKGSKVGPDTLRFDYAASRALTDDEAARIEDLVNREVLANVDVRTEVTTQAEARRRGAMMIFEEKYGDAVRMLHIGGESVELCGGTHVRRTGDIGLFKLVADAPLGAGVRRIEAVTGLNALRAVRGMEHSIRKVAETFRSSPSDVVVRAERALEEQRELQRQINELKKKLLSGAGADPLSQARTVGDVKVLSIRAPVAEAAAMRELAEQLRDKLGNAVVVVGAETPDHKATFVCMVAKGLAGRFHAGKIIQELATVVGGKGGGRPDMAQGGGPDASKLEEALARAYALVS